MAVVCRFKNAHYYELLTLWIVLPLFLLHHPSSCFILLLLFINKENYFVG